MIQSDDLVIADLAAALAEAEAAVGIYKEMVSVALTELQRAELQHQAHGRQLQALREELRRYTAARVPDCR